MEIKKVRHVRRVSPTRGIEEFDVITYHGGFIEIANKEKICN